MPETNLIDTDFKQWKEKFERQQDTFFEKIERLLDANDATSAKELLEQRYHKVQAIAKRSRTRKTAYYEADLEETQGYLLLAQSKLGLDVQADLKVLKQERPEDPFIQRIEASSEYQAVQGGQGRCDLVIVFDATGSQVPHWDVMQAGINHLIDHVTQFSGGIRIGIVAYRDYCDVRHGKLVEIQSFTNDAQQLTRFAASVECYGGGGNGGEAVEVGLHEAVRLLHESEASKRIVVLIGDEPAHGVMNCIHKDLNYKTETAAIRKMKVPIYTVCTLDYNHRIVREHYQWYASQTGGRALLLGNIRDLHDILTLIIGKETGNLHTAQRLLFEHTSDSEKQKRLHDYRRLLE